MRNVIAAMGWLALFALAILGMWHPAVVLAPGVDSVDVICYHEDCEAR